MAQNGSPAPKPLFADPMFDGAADPVLIWNKQKKEWWMFYTNRRATLNDTTGVQWVHGTSIGMATSKDGINWAYLDTATIKYYPKDLFSSERAFVNTNGPAPLAGSAGAGPGARTFWAPDVIEHKGLYHMYLTYVPGIFSDWQHPRVILHLTSKDLRNWTYESTLQLSSEKVIDASIAPLPNGGWRLWYNNEKDKKTIYYADSKDLYHWEDKGQALAQRGEGPKVFRWKNTNFMMVDVWKGMEVFQSDDLLHWKKQAARILEEPGNGKDDGAIGGHCDVVVSGDRAYVFYFSHPGRTKLNPAPAASVAAKRSVIQVAELKFEKGEISCNRDEPTYLDLRTKK